MSEKGPENEMPRMDSPERNNSNPPPEEGDADTPHSDDPSCTCQEVADLKAKIQDLAQIIDDRKRIAGDLLEDFSRLTPCEVQSLEVAVTAYRHSYANLMKKVNALDDQATGVSMSPDVELEIRSFIRMFEYRKLGKPYSELQPDCCMGLSCQCLTDVRARLAARLYWIQSREQGGKSVYVDERRYLPLQKNQALLRDALDEKYKWLLDWTEAPTFETTIFLFGVFYLMGRQQSWHEDIMETIQDAIRLGLAKSPQVYDFTTAATSEVTIKDDQDQILACPICGYHYGEQYDDALCIEPAIKTCCNHILGEQCLQNWIDANNSTCPLCRQAVYDADLVLPENLIIKKRAIENNLSYAKGLDESIDKYLKEGNVDVHTDGFVELTKEIQRLNDECNKASSFMYDFIHGYNTGSGDGADGESDQDGSEEDEESAVEPDWPRPPLTLLSWAVEEGEEEETADSVGLVRLFDLPSSDTVALEAGDTEVMATGSAQMSPTVIPPPCSMGARENVQADLPRLRSMTASFIDKDDLVRLLASVWMD